MGSVGTALPANGDPLHSMLPSGFVSTKYIPYIGQAGVIQLDMFALFTHSTYLPTYLLLSFLGIEACTVHTWW